MSRYRRSAPVALALLVVLALPAARARGGDDETASKNALNSITSSELKEHVDFLADDALLGRWGGSPGGHKAGEYIAKAFAALRLEPGMDGSYFQGFREEEKMRNVVGVLRGSDPVLREEFVVLGAHYDHVGQGGPGRGRMPGGGDDDIYNGADDNASGTSGVLEIAQAFSLLPTPPKRTIVFILFDAEERGLWGSRHYVEHPLFPLEKTVAMVNLDMIGRGEGKPVELYGALTGEGLAEIVAGCNESVALEYTVSRRMMYNSDHAPFVRRNIPVLFFFTGLHGDYHRPSDHADKIQHGGMEKIARLTFLIVQELANRDGRLAFKAPAAPPRRPVLGVEGMEVDGRYKIARVRPDRPASRGGLEAGDILLELKGETITTRRSLLAALWKVKKDETVEAKVLRDGEEVTLQIPFGAGKKKTRGWY